MGDGVVRMLRIPKGVDVDDEGRGLGEDWTLAMLGTGVDDARVYLTTDHVHPSEIPPELAEAESTARLLVELVNEHYDAQEDRRQRAREDLPELTGAERIQLERRRHLTEEERSVLSDVANFELGQLQQAATVLLLGERATKDDVGGPAWAWELREGSLRKRRLVLAGALIAAELDRLDYSDAQLRKAAGE